jgi:hypothetical protein
MSQIFPYKKRRHPGDQEARQRQIHGLLRDSRRQDGSGKLRYQRKAPTNEFDTEDEAIAYILDFRATGSTKIPCDPAARRERACRSQQEEPHGIAPSALFHWGCDKLPHSQGAPHGLQSRACFRFRRSPPAAMTTSFQPAGDGTANATPPARPPVPDAHRSALHAVLLRLHFYIGLFVGPFILVAALTGTLYVLTPQIESHLYAAQLYNQSRGGPAAGRTGEGRAGLLAAGAPVRGAPGQGGMEYPRDVHQPGLATRRAGPSSSIR